MKYTKSEFFKTYTSEDGKWEIDYSDRCWFIYEYLYVNGKLRGDRVGRGFEFTLREAKAKIEKMIKEREEQ